MKYKKGYENWLVENEVYDTKIKPEEKVQNHWFELSTGGVLTVYAGYAWDGASGPTIDTPAAKYASLAHDVFYQCMRQGLLPISMRKAVDEEFFRMLREKGMWWIRAKTWYLALRWKGRTAALPQSIKKVFEV